MPLYASSASMVIPLQDQRVVTMVFTAQPGVNAEWWIYEGRDRVGPILLRIYAPAGQTVVIPIPGGWDPPEAIFVDAVSGSLHFAIFTVWKEAR